MFDDFDPEENTIYLTPDAPLEQMILILFYYEGTAMNCWHVRVDRIEDLYDLDILLEELIGEHTTTGLGHAHNLIHIRPNLEDALFPWIDKLETASP